MLGWLGMKDTEKKVKDAVSAALAEGIATPDIYPDKKITTTDVGDWLVEHIIHFNK
jgi:isocitrate/isopropylmalate dehydrogenase